MQRKGIKLWVILLVLPYVLLIVTAFAQVIVHFALNNNPIAQPSTAVTVVNVLATLLGIVAALLILATPVWVILIVQAVRYNNALSGTAASAHPSTKPPILPQPPADSSN